MTSDLTRLRDEDLAHRQQRREDKQKIDELFKVTVDGELVLETSRHSDALRKAHRSDGAVIFVTDSRDVVVYTRTS